MTPLMIGIGLAVLVLGFARLVGLDSDAAFYPVVLIVVASYYVLFAVMAGARDEIGSEIIVFFIFAGLACLGFRAGLWMVAAGLMLHGLFDFVRQLFMAGRGVPDWWPAFCLGFDLAAGIGLAISLTVRPASRPLRRPTPKGL